MVYAATVSEKPQKPQKPQKPESGEGSPKDAEDSPRSDGPRPGDAESECEGSDEGKSADARGSRAIDSRATRKLTFRVSGMLWKRSLVMEDVETGSLWSHILGECLRGPLEGTRLEALPSEMVTWGDWVKRHPKSRVLALSRSARGFERKLYDDRFADFVVGIVLDGAAAAYPFDRLSERRFVEDTHAKTPLLITFDPDTTRASIFGREVDGRTLRFRFRSTGDAKALVDTETGSTWSPESGKATAGPLAGRQLPRHVGIVSFARAWRDFHPKSRIVPAKD